MTKAGRGHGISRQAALAVLLVLGFVVTACSSTGSGQQAGAASTPATTPTTKASRGAPPATGAPVHLSLLEGDGQTYGIGMPFVVYFDRKITDPAAFEQAAKVVVNGRPAHGAWYFEKSGRAGQALEAHYRLRQYWPAHAQIKLDLPVRGRSAGRGLAYDNSLTLAMSTGAANVSSVDCAAEKMTVTSDGKAVRTIPTSCGKATTPTFTGTKLVMQKGEADPATGAMRPDGAVRMISDNPADPYDLIVPWSVRITNSGEYVHAASWNGGNIGSRSTSNGCTNLNVNDAKWYYRFAQIGDVLNYTHTGGKPMPVWDGFGDWNVPWSTWQAGGALAKQGP